MIYILCPANFATGGPTLLHQLGYKLNLLGFEASMFYMNTKPDIDPVCEQYKKYNVPIEHEITAARSNIVIVPEIYIPYIPRLHNVQCIIWWLSVDKAVYSPEDISYAKTNNLLHLAQSQYAMDFLRDKLEIPSDNIFYLSDYLDSAFFTGANLDSSERENIVLFNPQKGFNNTSALIKHADYRIKWQALSGLTPSQMRDVMKTARVYIDFGNHPGKDRIPREAAMSGCCVVTNKTGSAANPIDVPIPDCYKFGDNASLQEVLGTLYILLDEYGKRKNEYSSYISKIKNEYIEFEKDVLNIFTKVTNRSHTQFEAANEYISKMLEKLNSEDYISAYQTLVHYRTHYSDDSVTIDIIETAIRMGLTEYAEASMCALRGLAKEPTNYELLLYLAKIYVLEDSTTDVTMYLDKAIQYSSGTPDEDTVKMMCKNDFNYQ